MSDTRYKFLPAEFALKVLEDKRLKVATLSELNDIYDFPLLVPAIQPGEVRFRFVDEIAGNVIKGLRDSHGLLCFSKDYRSPLLWGHYARGGTGLALGFDSDRLCWEDQITVSYSDKRPTLPPTQEIIGGIQRDLILRSGSVKAKEWGYENEVHYLVSLDECEPKGGLYFVPFEPNALTEVIAGPRFVGFSYLRRVLSKHSFPHVKFSEAIEHPTEYAITTR